MKQKGRVEVEGIRPLSLPEASRIITKLTAEIKQKDAEIKWLFEIAMMDGQGSLLDKYKKQFPKLKQTDNEHPE